MKCMHVNEALATFHDVKSRMTLRQFAQLTAIRLGVSGPILDKTLEELESIFGSVAELSKFVRNEREIGERELRALYCVLLSGLFPFDSGQS